MSVATEKQKEQPKPEQWHRIPGVCQITGFGQSFIYAEMQAGRLKSKKVRGARVISDSQLAEWQSKFDGAGQVSGNE